MCRETHCIRLQHTATCCYLHCDALGRISSPVQLQHTYCNTIQHTNSQCNCNIATATCTATPTATHCNTRTGQCNCNMYCNTLQLTGTHAQFDATTTCTATCCNTLIGQCDCNIYCNTYCNSLQQVKQFCCKYEWVVSNIWMSHVTHKLLTSHINYSCRSHKNGQKCNLEV